MGWIKPAQNEPPRRDLVEHSNGLLSTIEDRKFLDQLTNYHCLMKIHTLLTSVTL